MKTTIAILLFFLALRGNSQPTANASRAHAQGIINGTVAIDASLKTIAVMDSICANNKDTRQYYLNAYKVILQKAKGPVTTVIGMYGLCYLRTYTQECLLNYRHYTPSEQALFAKYIALYFDKEDYMEEIERYFSDRSKALPPDNKAMMKTLKNLKGKVLKAAAKQHQN